MNKELIKKLKELGFKQRGDGRFYGGPLYIGYEPTLSELINSCGEKRVLDDFDFKRFVLWYANSGDDKEKWYAGYYMYGDNLYIDDYPTCEEGETPEEAVANLWLSLNKKI